MWAVFLSVHGYLVQDCGRFEKLDMKWRKLGLVFCPSGEYLWMQSHAANPVAEFRYGDVFRIYFSSRDASKRSHIGYVDINLNHANDVLALSVEPVIGPGEVGTFDDSGTSMGCLVHHNGKRYLYYLGWNLGVTVPWRNSIGLAVSDGLDAPFSKFSPAPLVDRNRIDPYSISYPWVMIEGSEWRMWYGSNLRWGHEQGDMDHLLKYAVSDDGLNWERAGIIAIPFQSKIEYAMSKPTVLYDGEDYYMWYSYRGTAYRIGYVDLKMV